jgi:L-threonylcarbamoyladenylate synthase
MEGLTEAVKILRRGGLVAFPTETVYGLGADATNSAAVGKIFAAKGRPATNPLIVHVADEGVAQRYAKHWPAAAQRLAARFWPGPLTLVVPKSDAIVQEATAGLGTVGLRAPDHPLALALLRAFDGPVAAPSANRSTRISPTTAEHVREELGDRVDMILDGGPCRVGIESTVLDLSGDRAAILRPGGVTREQIEAVLGQPVEQRQMIAPATTSASSPGQHEVHYAPHTPAYHYELPQWTQLDQRLKSAAPDTWAVLVIGDFFERYGEEPTLVPIPPAPMLETAGRWVRRLTGRADPAPAHEHIAGIFGMPDTPEAYGRSLYAVLRRLDEQGLEAIYIELPPDEPPWSAIRDRILRATRRIDRPRDTVT